MGALGSLDLRSDGFFYSVFSINDELLGICYVRGLQLSLCFTPRGDRSNTDSVAEYRSIAYIHSYRVAGESIFLPHLTI